ncbi:MAG: FRG domain-containing protein [Nitrospirae bacterium]|nr:FRG domain-containing protein [Nitrospirota bacterium]
MVNIETYNKGNPIKNLNQFLEIVSRLREKWVKPAPIVGDENQLWFRGQQCEHWGLSPKFYRKEFKGADEAEIRQEFQSKALQLIPGRIPQGKFEWYFLMQHYGAPTRLLDWTDNPLVALYFAVEEKNLKDDDLKQNAVVWVLDPSWLNKTFPLGINGPILPEWKEANKYLHELEHAFSVGSLSQAKWPAAIEPPHIDRRLANQGSRFVIFGQTRDLTATADYRRSSCRLTRIVISQDIRNDIRRELEYNGISQSTLFPDLGHLCDDISRKWRDNTPQKKRK